MSYLNKAADDVKNFAKRIKPILELAEVLEKVGGLENAEKEALARLEKAKVEEANAKSSCLDAKHDLLAAEAKVKEAHDVAKAIIEKATDDSKSMQAYAEEKCKEIEAKASEFKLKVFSESQVEQAKLEEVKKEIQLKKYELEQIKKDITDLKSKFFSLVK